MVKLTGLNGYGTLIIRLFEAKAVDVVLQPVASKLDNDTIYHLAKDISLELKNLKVTVLDSIEPYTEAEVQFAFDKHRNQWD